MSKTPEHRPWRRTGLDLGAWTPDASVPTDRDGLPPSVCSDFNPSIGYTPFQMNPMLSPSSPRNIPPHNSSHSHSCRRVRRCSQERALSPSPQMTTKNDGSVCLRAKKNPLFQSPVMAPLPRAMRIRSKSETTPLPLASPCIHPRQSDMRDNPMESPPLIAQLPRAVRLKRVNSDSVIEIPPVRVAALKRRSSAILESSEDDEDELSRKMRLISFKRHTSSVHVVEQK